MTNEEREDLNTFKHDLVKQARWWQWKAETLEKENEQLKAENAALRERLEKAVELKARVGDVIYIPWINDGKDAISELPINKISVHKDNFVLYWVDLSKCDKDYMWAAPKPNYTHTDLGSVVFLTRKAAESRLAELKGEKGCAKT